MTDYDEPWYDETNEETFRPWTGSLPIGPEQGMFLVQAEALLNDGTRLPAFLTPAHVPGDLGALQPHVFVDDRPFGFWGGVVGISEEIRVGFFESLGRRHDQVFPLVVAVTRGLAKGETTAHVKGWPTPAPGMTPKPRKRFRGKAIALASLLIAVVVWFGFTIWQSTAVFTSWQSQLFDHPLPKGAVVVDSGGRFGHWEGNGKHCDGEAWLLLAGVGESAAQAHYEGVHGNLRVEEERDVDADYPSLVRVTISEMYLTEHAYDPRCW